MRSGSVHCPYYGYIFIDHPLYLHVSLCLFLAA